MISPIAKEIWADVASRYGIMIPFRYQTTEQRLRSLGPRTLQRIARLAFLGYRFTWDGERGIWWVRYPSMAKQPGCLNELIAGAQLWANQKARWEELKRK